VLSASRAPPAGSRLGGGDDRAREFEHRPRSSSVTSTWIARAVPLFATVHRPSFGPRLPPLAIHTPRNTTAAVKPKTKSVTARFVRDGNRDLEETVQSITTPPASMTASGIANAIAHPARRVNGRCHLKVGRHSRILAGRCRPHGRDVQGGRCAARGQRHEMPSPPDRSPP